MRPRSVPRLYPLLLCLILLCAGPAAAQTALRGLVVDPAGRPVSRAVVSVLDANGVRANHTFTRSDGTFEIDAPASGCTVRVALSGFDAVSTACSTDRDLRLTLSVAPVEESVVVSATRGEAPGGQIAASFTVFDAAAIERRQAPPVAELLRRVPGATVVTAGGLGNVTSLFVRGGESSYNKVLLDGIPLNEPGGTFNFSNITTANLERVEVVRGAHSALFGSDAMSSVVQMFTARGRPGPPRAMVLLEGGSYGTARASAGVSGSSRGFDYSLQAARLTTDNRAPNNVFQNTTLSGTAGLALGTRADLRVVVRAELGNTGVPGATAFGRPDLDAAFNRDDVVAGFTLTQQATGSLTQRFTYALAASDQASTNLVADPPYTPQFASRRAPFEFSDFPYDSRTDLRRHHAAYQLDWQAPLAGRAGTHLVTAAIDWNGERARLEDALAGTVTRAGRDNFGATLQHQVMWPQVFVTTGLRIERNESFGTSAVPRVGVAWLPRVAAGAFGTTKLKGSAGLGIKEPTILQSFSPNPFFLGNPALEPERSRGIDAGIEQRLAHDRVRVELTWFHNRFENIISTRTISFNPFVSQYFNVGLTRARGAELTVEAAPVDVLHLRGGYTLLDSRVLTSTAPANPVFAEGAWLFRRPRHSGFLEVAWTWRAFSVDAGGLFVGRRVDSDFASLEPPLVENEGYVKWDLRGAYRMSSHLTWFVVVENLTDVDYMEPLGFPALKRAVRIGARVGF